MKPKKTVGGFVLSIVDCISIRSVDVSDVNFIMSSATHCLSRYRKTMFRGWDMHNLNAYIGRIILCAINNLDYSILIACHKDDDNHILGYIVADSKSNHVLLQYTKFSFRDMGIQQLMIPLILNLSQTISIQFCTADMKALVTKKIVILKDGLVESLINLIDEKEKKDGI